MGRRTCILIVSVIVAMIMATNHSNCDATRRLLQIGNLSLTAIMLDFRVLTGNQTFFGNGTVINVGNMNGFLDVLTGNGILNGLITGTLNGVAGMTGTLTLRNGILSGILRIDGPSFDISYSGSTTENGITDSLNITLIGVGRLNSLLTVPFRGNGTLTAQTVFQNGTSIGILNGVVSISG